ncbi:uncharacterized protein LOC141664957 [Apium graveolens]|uniref:uncharacterized protein LOC141664957 n=1 Tax=Apium graveolens TaxID=4045 RepID=UPI003D7AA1AF
MWDHERHNKSNKNAPATFSLCCKNGQVELPKEKQPPESLASLLTSNHFRPNIRVYNAMFAMCSSGGRIDHKINKGRAQYCYKVGGQNLHFIGSLLPEEGSIRDQVDQNIVEALMQMFHEHNKVVEQFITAREHFKNDTLDEYRLVLISSEVANGHPNIIGPSNEVGGLIVQKNPDTPVRRGDNDPDHIGKCIILPASFTGSKRYMSQYFKDSLALCRVIRHPTLFLTMTCNSKWPEIKEMMKHLPDIDVYDAPDIVTRLHPDDGLKNSDQIDAIVSAEIPDQHTDPIGYAAIKKHMIHGPCGQDFTYSPCMVKGKCMRHFPKRYNSNTCFYDCGIPIYRRRKTSSRVKVKGLFLDNQYVVPFNRDLLIKFQCHINVEICNNSRSLKHLFKYCLKGHDNATMMIQKERGSLSLKKTNNLGKSMDEVKHYLDGHYVCASETSWRIFGFDIHSRWPTVDRLPVHLPGEKHVSFKTGESLQKVCDRANSKRTKLEAWFLANKNIPSAHLQNVNGHVYDSFKESCAALGLLLDDSQWHEAIIKNAHSSFLNQLREMFVNILAYYSVSDPLSLWNEHWSCFSDDVEHHRKKATGNNNLRLSEADVKNYALVEIEKLLNDIGKSLKDFPTMHFPPDVFRCTDLNRLIIEETSYNKDEMKELHDANYNKLNAEQMKVY